MRELSLLDTTGMALANVSSLKQTRVIKVDPRTLKIEEEAQREFLRKNKGLATRILQGFAVTSRDPVGVYLGRRVGMVSFPAVLRYVARMAYQDAASSDHPGMVAMVTAPDGKPATLHRTYLTTDGRKAAVECPRRLMPGTLPKGSAVRLMPSAIEMGVAEGIETALAASSLFGMPVWAALNASNLEAWNPPPGVERVVVFADNDESFDFDALFDKVWSRPHKLMSRKEINLFNTVVRIAWEFGARLDERAA